MTISSSNDISFATLRFSIVVKLKSNTSDFVISGNSTVLSQKTQTRVYSSFSPNLSYIFEFLNPIATIQKKMFLDNFVSGRARSKTLA